jgi:DNA-binding transcriptional regulator YhcF (GntR family)
MKRSGIFDLIVIDELSATPKYQQVVNAILEAIRRHKIKKGDILPSINEFSFEFDISRITVEKGYNHLKIIGILDSVPGKGYFVKSVETSQNLNIFLLFNKLSSHKKIIYDTLVETLGQQAAIDFYIYNNDATLFQRIIYNRKQHYTHFVIIPHFVENEEKAYQAINTLPKDKVILLDKLLPQITGEFGAVYENFEKDIYSALQQACPVLSKYHTIKIIFPENSYIPQEIIIGFENFCRDYAFRYQVVRAIANEAISIGEVYISLMEDDLVTLIEKIQALKLTVGSDVGIISYNETALKHFILNGLTTISTDFKAMGRSAAELILSNSKHHIQNPFYLTLRPSL